MKIKALSIVSPSGSRIASGHKTIEVRSWLPDLGSDQDLLIVENHRFLKAQDHVDPKGRAVAIVKIKSVRRFEVTDIPAACATTWADGYHSWELKDVRPISYPDTLPAQRDLYEVELEDEKIEYLPVHAPVLDEPFYQARFLELLRRNQLITDLLERSSKLNVPNWAFGAGFLQQTVFNIHHGMPALSGIKDIDWVYFDASDLSEDAERRVIEHVQTELKDIPIPLDIKNQARVHLWYERKFGYSIRAYESLEDAIATWPTTSTAIALTKQNDDVRIIAPFGLADLMSMSIKPNKRQITEAIYNAKINRWKTIWPNLSIHAWESV